MRKRVKPKNHKSRELRIVFHSFGFAIEESSNEAQEIPLDAQALNEEL